jgi:hypothetical protein
MKLVNTQYKIKDWAKPWKEDIKAIYADTGYHLDTEANLRDITYYGQVYNETTVKYEYGVIAVVSSPVGGMPTPPSTGDMDIEPGWMFDKWYPDLRTVQYNYSYTAEYRQSAGMCWTGFYLDDTNLISKGYVAKGTVPTAPDMSQYNTADRQFVDWWPTLHASTDNSQSYYAIFRGYVNVTFEDKDGKVLSKQRVLTGVTPTAPKADDIIEGEEDYYELHFSHWASANGSRLGPVYSDMVYSPVYDKHYFEVTTVFDADGHTFADGTKTKEFKGTYANDNFLYMPKISYRDEYAYEVDYWQSTEMVNGSYVRLNMSDLHTDYKYNLTFKPVFKIKERLTYTVRFDGGDETLYFTGRYGDTITSDMLAGLKKTSPTDNYVYVLSDYGLKLPYSFGTVLDADGLPAVDINVKVQFTLTGVSKTFTFDANGGKYTDNSTAKTVTGPYGSEASFSEVPVKADDAQYAYTFVGWSYKPDAKQAAVLPALLSMATARFMRFTAGRCR